MVNLGIFVFLSTSFLPSFFYVKKIPIVIQITSTLTEIPTKGIKYKVKLTNLFSII